MKAVEEIPMSVSEAILVIAMNAAARAAETAAEEDWHDYPDVGENDWKVIAGTIQNLCPYPNQPEFERALAVLAARAQRT
jgi:hypothetical protein